MACRTAWCCVTGIPSRIGERREGKSVHVCVCRGAAGVIVRYTCNVVRVRSPTPRPLPHAPSSRLSPRCVRVVVRATREQKCHVWTGVVRFIVSRQVASFVTSASTCSRVAHLTAEDNVHVLCGTQRVRTEVYSRECAVHNMLLHRRDCLLS